MEMRFSVGSGVTFGFSAGGSYQPEPSPGGDGVSIIKGEQMLALNGVIISLEPQSIVQGTMVIDE